MMMRCSSGGSAIYSTVSYLRSGAFSCVHGTWQFGGPRAARGERGKLWDAIGGGEWRPDCVMDAPPARPDDALFAVFDDEFLGPV
jgi:hypothetical protein